MLTRVYIDNFRCLQNFEVRFGRRNLILGGNGAGKSSLVHAMYLLRQFAVANRSDAVEEIFIGLSRPTSERRQTFEVEAVLDGEVFVYRLVVEPSGSGEMNKPQVALEEATLGGRRIFHFSANSVELFDGEFHSIAEYPSTADRSAFASAYPAEKNPKFELFRSWMGRLLCFRLNPFAMGLETEQEEQAPNPYLTNFPSWYRHLVQSRPLEAGSLREALSGAIDGFRTLLLDSAGKRRFLLAEIERPGNGPVRFGFGQLSDGQRCLICLYAILHFEVARGATVLIDEPDNFISLREIQPWLTALTDMVDGGRGQAILVSHHPEILNQWAADVGLEFRREGAGPVRVSRFEPLNGFGLPPAEAIARGWTND